MDISLSSDDRFLFVDTFPDLKTWAATQTALDSDEASELEDMFDEERSGLWRMLDFLGVEYDREVVERLKGTGATKLL